MIRLLRAEWLKLRKRWMPRVLVLILLIVVGLILWAVGTSNTDRSNLFMPRGLLLALLFTAAIGPFFWSILAGSWAGSEYGWGTIRLVLSRRPDRTQFVLSAMMILVACVLLGLVAAMALSALVAVLAAALTGNSYLDTAGLDSGFILIFLKMLLATWWVLGFYVVVAYAAGTLFRSGSVGIGVGIGIIVADFVVRGIFLALGGVWKNVSEHFPTVYSNALISRLGTEGLQHGFHTTGSNTPEIPQSIIGMVMYTVVPVALALYLVRFRDVTA